MTLAITPNQPPFAIASDNNNGGSSFSRENRLLKLLGECKDMSQLKQIHAKALRKSPTNNNPETLFLYSRILHFSSTVNTDYAFRVFDQIETPNSFMWNTLIRACAKSSDLKWKAMALYESMLIKGCSFPDKYTFPFVLKACAYLFAFREGIQVHAHVAKFGFGSDVYVNNSLIHFYASCGRLDLARKVFDEMPERSVVSWNALIDGLVQSGEFEQALSLFRRMQTVFEFDPDGYTLQSVVNACAGLGALSLGMWAHCYSLRKGISDVDIGSSLIEMYCKCGSLELAERVFEAMPKRDVTAWNAMILGFAAHGQAESALRCFSRLVESREESFGPNSITFVGALTACSHGGMVDRGREIFDSMVKDHGIEPKIEHYGCLVDLLSRAGLVDEALEFVEKMPVKPDAVIWRSLLDGAASWRRVELGERLAGEILRSERRGKSDSGVYVLLSRLYASAEMWNDVGLVRKLMEEEGVAKEPGCSLIEVDGVPHEFFSGDTSHAMSEEIYRWLDLIGERVQLMGYSPDYSQAAMVDEGGDKKGESLRVHSERIAVAFGLIKSEPGVPIRIFKNLRVCDDCHNVFKLVSEAFGVEIITRDRTRFHRFRDGNCSCNDYW